MRIVGQPPLQATVYQMERLRCNLCGEVFTAEAPDGVGTKKHDETSASMIALLKYGSGFPFYRLEGLQENLQIPLPAATQWGIVAAAATLLQPAIDELIRQAAQGKVLHNDDTSMKVLGLMKEATSAEADSSDPPERTAVFTSGIVSTTDGQKIALFFTGRKHAGENLSTVLARRAAEQGPPIQMCDALSRNLPKSLQVILGYCLAHGRRRFVEVAPNFPSECRYVLEALGEIYHHDELAREPGMTPEERLRFHQVHSGPVMEKLHACLTAQLEENRVEPNSGLGQAITYMRKHWEKLTLFLRQTGAPIDNNLCERALKKAILHRKNSLFYKTRNGARVGDLYMKPYPHGGVVRRQPIRLSDRVAKARHGPATESAPDAMELPSVPGGERRCITLPQILSKRKKFAVSCCDCVDLAGGQAVGEQNGVDDEAAIAGEIVTM